MSKSNACQNCPIECNLCTSKTNCISCKLGYYKDLFTYTCNLTCPDGQYIDPSIQYICILCNTTCLTCTAVKCNSCKPGFYLDIF